MTPKKNLPLDKDTIVADYRIAYKSRQASKIGRREVLSGRAKFGIFGAGKEVTQLAIAHAFKKGDWRSGYYRDQTWLFALGVLNVQEFFAQLYAHADVEADPATAGRAMNAHFASRYLNPDGSWKDQTKEYNVSADVSPTGSQMPRLVGLAYASNLYRNSPELQQGFETFSDNGNEVAWGTIGNASTAEGMFWEAVNAIGVLQAPAVITIYDDGYGISVPNEFQMVKENIGNILSGFQRDTDSDENTSRGYDIYSVRAWDYPALLDTYWAASNTAREYHIPALVHVTEVTQPQGHSTSGSHERYKNKERLDWEAEFDCNLKMRTWMFENEVISEEELNILEKKDLKAVEGERKKAWQAFQAPIMAERENLAGLLDTLAAQASAKEKIKTIRGKLVSTPSALYRDQYAAVHAALRATRQDSVEGRQALVAWQQAQNPGHDARFSSHLYSETAESLINVKEVKPVFSSKSPMVQAFDLLNHGFDAIFERDKRVVAFGEDVGHLGAVNQGFRGLQGKYGTLKIMDTGIREVTILGQAIGMAMRGLRPIAEIQYLDYLLYPLQLMSDDLASLLWRTKGGQKAPVIVRTRGHRLEGIWHAGSPMGAIIHLVRGMAVLVPRDAVQAAGFYNTLLKADEPGIIVEVLNGYRLKEKLPDNIGEVTVPVGVPETLREGTDITLVTYGAMCRIVLEAAEELAKADISVEVIDVQSLLPFDLHGHILESLKKTNRILFADEDVPGGATAFMLQEIIEKQGGYYWLDSPAATLTAKAHRPAFGSDGDYWSKPNTESVYDAVYEIMSEANPQKYPSFYN
ncbi:MAG: transketolase [Anaerolineae bacterium]|jgi:2-oxoisovalerate dehydrogenase E1 component|nr:transketolase [Anaerolineae bacterium]MBT7072424.1 transketolase [Anaerolineae bacterium]MBT7326579.1 transketolase [Anaerolineae bacterium]